MASLDKQIEPPAESYSRPYRAYVLALLTLVYVTNFADRSILSTLTQPIKEEFALSDQLMGAMGGVAFAVFYTGFGLPIALLADRWNRTRVIAMASATWSFFTVLCSVAGNAWQLFAARVGVGIGEAGGSPPAHAIISDLYPPKHRATALAIYAMGVPIGLAIGNFIGAPIAEAHGWRTAFLVLGLPGLALSLLVWLTVREPRRGMADIAATGDAAAGRTLRPSLASVFAFMRSQPALVHVIAGATIVTLTGYAGANWNAAFLMRSHRFTLPEAGFYLGMVTIFATVAGTFLGGVLADWFGKSDQRWNTWIVALFYAIGLPVTALAYSTEDTVLLMWLLPIPTFVAGVYLGPTFAMVQNLVGVRMRALASALLLFVINLIGMSIGPWLAGILSDILAAEYGERSLAQALFLLYFLNIWGIGHYVLASRRLIEGYERATHQ